MARINGWEKTKDTRYNVEWAREKSRHILEAKKIKIQYGWVNGEYVEKPINAWQLYIGKFGWREGRPMEEITYKTWTRKSDMLKYAKKFMRDFP